MANIKSAKKRILVNAKKAEQNKSVRSKLRTYIKHFEAAVEENNVEEAQRLIKIIDKNLKKATLKNIVHENAASRKLSKLTKELNAIS